MTKIPDAATSVADESVPLPTVPGTGRMSSDQSDIPTGHVRDYRQLAIGSIICGISCIGIFALINSVKVRERRTSDPEKAQIYSHKARKFSLIAIAVWVGVLILIPVLMALVSFLLTLKD